MKVAMCYPGGRKKAVTLSYDDGVAQDMKLIEVMNRYGLKGTFNLNGGCIPEEDATDGDGKMSRRQLVEAYSNSGHEVAIHGYTHPTLNSLSVANITTDVLLDRLELEQLFGGIIRGMAYPYGAVNDKVVNCLKACGIVYARTVVSTGNFGLPEDWLRMPTTCHHNDARLFDLAEEFLNKKRALSASCQLFYLWGHSFEFDRDHNWDRIEKFAQMVGNRSDIWYATNIAIYDYVQAYESLCYNIEGTVVYNPTQIDVWINVNADCVIEVKAGQTVALPEFVDDLAKVVKIRLRR